MTVDVAQKIEGTSDVKGLGGKRLADIYQAKNDATGKASDVGRQLGFAGIATAWLLRGEGAQPLDSALLYALTLLALALLVDFMQYVYCSIIWKAFYNEQFKKHRSDDVFVDIPDHLSERAYRFFWAKIVLLFLGYGWLVLGAVKQLQVI